MLGSKQARIRSIHPPLKDTSLCSVTSPHPFLSRRCGTVTQGCYSHCSSDQAEGITAQPSKEKSNFSYIIKVKTGRNKKLWMYLGPLGAGKVFPTLVSLPLWLGLSSLFFNETMSSKSRCRKQLSGCRNLSLPSSSPLTLGKISGTS